jgi:hypothetical protein
MDQVVDLLAISNFARLCKFRFEIVEMLEIRIVWHMKLPKSTWDAVVREDQTDWMARIKSIRPFP